MNIKQANREAKKIYDEWSRERANVEKRAKDTGEWQTTGLDGNNHLFKEVNEKAQEKLRKLKERIDK